MHLVGPTILIYYDVLSTKHYITHAVTFCTVKQAPNFLTYLMEGPLTAHLFKDFGDESYVLAFLLGIPLLMMVVAAAGTCVYLR
jgi:hypothetical protein